MPTRRPLTSSAALDAPSTVPSVVSWIAQRRGQGPGSAGKGLEAPENAAFRAGEALAHLHAVAMRWIEAVPVMLPRNWLALVAAVAEGARSGEKARAGKLRDRMGFLQSGGV